MQYQLVAHMAAGLEALVARELQALGYKTRNENGKVFFLKATKPPLPKPTCGCALPIG